MILHRQEPIVITFILMLLLFPPGSYQGPHERRLLNDLMANYNSMERPVHNESDPVFVSFGLTLQQLIDVDEKNQFVVSNIMLSYEWVDSNLRWNASEYGGVTDIRLAAGRVWKPDILLYNSADERIDSTFAANVIVRNNGSCLWLPPGIFKSTCKIDITWFPFDDQVCRMKFGSWSYTASALDLRLHSEDGADLSTYIENGEWILLGMPGVRNVVEYECCPEAYLDITFFINLRRRTLYYGFNLIIPCMIISSMVLLGFTLPPESGEKLTLGVTILLSMSVFMLQLTDTLPPTSESVSIIGTYFACIMIVVACSVVMTVVVLNFHHRTSESCEMPRWVKVIVLTWLPFILRMSRPGDIKPPKKPASPDGKGTSPRQMKSDIPSISKEYTEQIHAARGAGLISSVMDLEDDYLQLHTIRGTNPCHNCSCYGQLNSYPQQKHNCAHHLNHSTGAPSQFRHGPTSSLHCCEEHHHLHPHSPHPHSLLHHQQSGATATVQQQTSASVEPGSGLPPNCPLNESPTVLNPLLHHSKEINAILKELRFITNRMRREDELGDIIQEWKFAGMVIDRLCLIVFTAFTIISTVVCLSSPPHLVT